MASLLAERSKFNAGTDSLLTIVPLPAGALKLRAIGVFYNWDM